MAIVPALAAHPRLTLITGGARAGKSTFALGAVPADGPVRFIATAEAFDEEMRTRIERHRTERPGHWETVEEPTALAQAIATTPPEVSVIVDCLTLWTSNLLLRDWPADEQDAPHDWHPDVPLRELLHALAERRARTDAAPVVLVSNEVGLGIVPASAMGRAYRDALGRVNQRVAAIADEVILVVAGLPLVIKPTQR